MMSLLVMDNELFPLFVMLETGLNLQICFPKLYFYSDKILFGL